MAYGVHVYGSSKAEPQFLMATSLYHPDTVQRSIAHDGSGEEPGLKDPVGNWDVRPHRDRILLVDERMLRTWHALLEGPNTPVDQARMVYTVNRASADVLIKLASAPRLGSLNVQFSAGWHEKNDRTKGYFDSEWGVPESWREVILQGPHFHVGVPFYKAPNATMANNLDWSTVDLETLPPEAVPVTSYKPRGSTAKYDTAYTHWVIDDEVVASRDYYRVAWRRMAANTGERTLVPAILPPGAAHVHPVHTVAIPTGNTAELVKLAGFLSSLVHDFCVRSVPKSEILFSTVRRMPWSEETGLDSSIRLRVLRLNALTSAYADLWNDVAPKLDLNDEWTGGLTYPARPALGGVGTTWGFEVPLTRAADRRQASLEIDALVALAVGLTADELATVYKSQFAVLYGYDRNTYFFDANGRLVPNSVLTVWRRKGDDISLEERTATNPSGNTYVYELPFVTLDREADMRQAYAHFEKVLAERGGA